MRELGNVYELFIALSSLSLSLSLAFSLLSLLSLFLFPLFL